jgi:hypothetical protein
MNWQKQSGPRAEAAHILTWNNASQRYRKRSTNTRTRNRYVRQTARGS